MIESEFELLARKDFVEFVYEGTCSRAYDNDAAVNSKEYEIKQRQSGRDNQAMKTLISGSIVDDQKSTKEHAAIDKDLMALTSEVDKVQQPGLTKSQNTVTTERSWKATMSFNQLQQHMNTLFTQPSSYSNKSALTASAFPDSRFSPQKVAPDAVAA